MLTRATQEVTSAIVHELEPILGLLRLSAMAEIPNYPASETQERIQRLEALAFAVGNLRRASQPPFFDEFNLADTIRTIAHDVGQQPNIVLAGNPQVTASHSYRR
jgi:hypothetical protein